RPARGQLMDRYRSGRGEGPGRGSRAVRGEGSTPTTNGGQKDDLLQVDPLRAAGCDLQPVDVGACGRGYDAQLHVARPARYDARPEDKAAVRTKFDQAPSAQ